MLKELEAVLGDQTFARSPVLARLLRYLVEESMQGRGAALKSYTVAVEGLGKSSDFDPQVDTYARVIVGRLRKALDIFYAAGGCDRPHRLSIKSGSYEVSLTPHLEQPSPQQDELIWRRPSWTTINLQRIATVGILAVLGILLMWRVATGIFLPTNLGVWRTSNFPTIGVLSSGNSQATGTTYDKERLRTLILGAISKYPSVRPLNDPGANADYRLALYEFTNGGVASLMVNVVESKSNRVIWSRKFVMGSGNDIESVASELSFLLANTTGVVNQNELKRHFDTNTPYGCWLKFSIKVQTDIAGSDAELNRCAENWYSAVPNHPLAAALYGWTLVDQSIFKPTEVRHREALQQAIGVLDKAKSLFPDSPFLHVSAARAYDFAGDTEAMQASARLALELAPENPDILGSVGMMLTLQNDPAGEALLNDALAKRVNPPSWYFVGKFMAAIMHDDTDAAGKAIASVEDVDHSLNMLPLLSAAFHARTGRLPEARKSWDEAKASIPILRLNPDLMFERMPMSKDVRSRFKQWLAPLLG